MFITRTHIVALCLLLTAPWLGGCRSRQTAQVMLPHQQDTVGSHSAGAETFRPLVRDATGRLLGRHDQSIQQTGVMPGQRVCFVGVENHSAEEVGDFREQIYEEIDTQISGSGVFQPVSRRYVEAGLRELRLRPDQLFVPDNMRQFSAYMEQMGQPFDQLLYAKLTSGTTQDNRDYQRDYMLTLDMVDVRSGQYTKESALLRKGYNVSTWSKFKNWWR